MVSLARVTRGRDTPGPEWTGWLPSAFVVTALLLLLLLPLLEQRAVREPRRVLEHAADPARTHVTRIQYLLAHQTSMLRSYLLTGDSSALVSYRLLAAEERDTYLELRPLVDQLGTAAISSFTELRTDSEQWHERIDAARLVPISGSVDRARQELPLEPDLYLDALNAARSLDLAITAAGQAYQARIIRSEHRAAIGTVALAFLAIVAALMVARLSARVHRLARVAEARRYEAERALEENARTVESKERLLRGVTHDVKNPLGAADGYAELLELGLRGDLTEGQQEMVSGIRRSIQAALRIIEDLLNLAHAESGGLRITRAPLDLAGLVRAVAADHMGAVGAAGLSLEVVSADEPLPVHTDELRVRQIVGNLFSNAVKYTPTPGHIVVRVGPSDDVDQPRPGRWAAVRVADSGPGIPPERREQVFEEFYRLPDTKADGHGVGLAISRRIARLLGGDITLTSEVGRGSTFTLWLPLRDDESVGPQRA